MKSNHRNFVHLVGLYTYSISILSSTSTFPKRFFFHSAFPVKEFKQTFHTFHPCYTPRPSHGPRFHCPNNMTSLLSSVHPRVTSPPTVLCFQTPPTCIFTFLLSLCILKSVQNSTNKMHIKNRPTFSSKLVRFF